MTIKEFIEAAIKEGYGKGMVKPISYKQNEKGNYEYKPEEMFVDYLIKNIHIVVLDPKTWQAVGKVKGWEKKFPILDKPPEDPQWFLKSCDFWASVMSGKTLEEYIATL